MNALNTFAAALKREAHNRYAEAMVAERHAQAQLDAAAIELEDAQFRLRAAHADLRRYDVSR